MSKFLKLGKTYLNKKFISEIYSYEDDFGKKKWIVVMNNSREYMALKSDLKKLLLELDFSN